MMGDEELAREVITQFLTDLPTVIRDLQQQIAESDLISIGKSAHRIKGSAANVGGEALADAASRLEQAAKSGDWAEAALSAKNVAWEATRLQEILNGWE
jgi:HPt (histidine-containing phosphotransfer) domain-containing protein